VATIGERLAAMEGRFEDLLETLKEESAVSKVERAQIMALVKEVQDAMTIPPEHHELAHKVLDEWIKRENTRKERNEKIRAQVGGWLVISVLGGIALAAWNLFLHFWAIFKHGG
jgi:hypothetical protein